MEGIKGISTNNKQINVKQINNNLETKNTIIK
jgi:hypothetical protein